MAKQWLATLLCLLLLAGCAAAEEAGWAALTPRDGDAPDITQQCSFRVSARAMNTNALSDQKYEYPWQSGRSRKLWLEITLPEGEACSGVSIKWAVINAFWRIETRAGDKWVVAAEGDHEHLHTYTALPDVTAFRIIAEQPVKNRFQINELIVLGRGDKPAWVQDWRSTPKKADLLLLVAHPDDEYVFMGGVVPYYAAERGKRVVVAYITESTYQRRSELLDGLWTAGLRDYPVTGVFRDRYSQSLKVAYDALGKKKTQRYMIRLLRRFRPDVVVTHDTQGEYGHAVHKLAADIALYAADKAGDAAVDPESAAEYGVWTPYKLYLHLYPRNQSRMDWNAPLAAFNGRTAFEVADAAFALHVSQRNTPYEVYRDGLYDSSLFGLAYSSVGKDEAGGDFFEHVGELGV